MKLTSGRKYGKIDNVADLKKRTRSYDSSISFLVCTPTEENGQIWKEFLKSSQGYWYLRCQGCGELSMRSCDIHNLQFESEYNEELRQYIVKPESIRLVCQYCKFEHTEDMKHVMNVNGGYIHKIPSKLNEAPGYCLHQNIRVHHEVQRQNGTPNYLRST